jgi:hypothetical protein
MRRGRSLTPSPTNNMHQQSIVNRLLYIVYYTSHVHTKILPILTEWTLTEDYSLVRDLLYSLGSCNVLTLANSLLAVINLKLTKLCIHIHKRINKCLPSFIISNSMRARAQAEKLGGGLNAVRDGRRHSCNINCEIPTRHIRLSARHMQPLSCPYSHMYMYSV